LTTEYSGGNGSLERLKSLLVTEFELDSPELDFGIYRIMNYRRKEIEEFIEKELLGAVETEFERFRTQSTGELQQSLENKKKEIQALEKQINERILKNGEIEEKFLEKPIAKEYLEIRKQLEGTEVTESIKNQVFNDLYTFFSRYYQDGDFISQRRRSFRQHRYAIPYDGEEVKLHWANFDQYYVKTCEVLKNYEFRRNGWRIVFRTIIAEGSVGNVEKERRYFVLHSDTPLEIKLAEKTCVINFEYKPLEDKDLKRFDIRTKTGEEKTTGIKQENLNHTICEKILKQASNAELRSALASKEGEKTALEKNLYKYARRATSDFFIHKDLKGFLEGELDYFVKTEVIDLTNLEPRRTTRANVVAALAGRIIEFLSQIEEYQKRLWEKKKLVIKTDYVVTLDLIPQAFHQEILDNKEQLKEWKELGFGDLRKENVKGQKVPVDTRHFPESFKERLLEKLSETRSLDDLIDGVLIKSDNFHVLRLLQSAWSKRVNCVYVDPPFNTAASEILYKNNYKHSSWICLLWNAIQSAIPLMRDDSIICVAIDDAELRALSYCLSSIFGEERELATVVVRSNPHGRAMASGFSRNHEYALFFGKTDQATIGRLPRSVQKKARYPKSDEKGFYAWISFMKTGAGSKRPDRPKLFYPIYVSKKGAIRISSMSWSQKTRQWEPLEPLKSDESVVLPIDDEESERVWNLGWERAREEVRCQTSDWDAKLVDGKWQVSRKYRPNQEGAVPGTWWEDAKYSATESGTKILKDLFGERESFSYPKSVHLVEDCLRASNCSPGSWVIDFVAGSGTTAHAVINLNREDNCRRKYILVEVADYFDTVILPRIKKVVFSEKWKDGKPILDGDSKPVSHMIKYHYLEQYEDSLHNIEFPNRDKGRKLTEFLGSEASKDYVLKYFLQYETEGSPSLLNLSRFENPFAYKLRTISTGRGEETVDVDLVETFNYLIGLNVDRYRFVEANGRKYVFVLGHCGNRRTAVVWRPTNDIDLTKDKEVIQRAINGHDPEETYINGDAYVESYKPIESEFKALLEG